MGVQSMTGYGKAEANGEGWSVVIELKSVNNRFLETQFRTPKNLLGLELRFKQCLNKWVSRGSIHVAIQYESNQTNQDGIHINEKVLNQYFSTLNRIRELSKTSSGPLVQLSDADPIEILKLPDVLTHNVETEDLNLLEERIFPVFEKACNELADSRGREGETLRQDLERRVLSFVPCLERIRELIPLRQKDYNRRMRARVQEICGEGITINEDRLLTELSLLAERLDVTEEIVRFGSHVDLFQKTMLEHKSPGKKLGFILQEMLREVNTLGTKSQYTDIVHQCVDLKEELEIIREQIQNIE